MILLWLEKGLKIKTNTPPIATKGEKNSLTLYANKRGIHLYLEYYMLFQNWWTLPRDFLERGNNHNKMEGTGREKTSGEKNRQSGRRVGERKGKCTKVTKSTGQGEPGTSLIMETFKSVKVSNRESGAKCKSNLHTVCYTCGEEARLSESIWLYDLENKSVTLLGLPLPVFKRNVIPNYA